VARSRWNWLFIPVGFAVAFRAALWLYWLPERNAWVAAHGGDSAAAAYGEGEMDARAVLYTVGPLILSVACCAIGAAPGRRRVLLFGVLSAGATCALGAAIGPWLAQHVGSGVATHAPALAATLVVLAYHYSQIRRAICALPPNKRL
jgi:hypothetical protein